MTDKPWRAKQFLPEYKSVPTSNGYRPSYRLFVGEKEKMVPYPGGPQYFPTSDGAVRAAMAYVETIINRDIVGEPIETELSELEKWRQDKDRAQAAELAKVFGAKPPIVRDCRGNVVMIETRRPQRQ